MSKITTTNANGEIIETTHKTAEPTVLVSVPDSLQCESRVYRLYGLTPLLGSAPASQAIRTQYIASKAPTSDRRSEEEAELFNVEEQGLTVFRRDTRDQLCLMDYQIKGFFKEAFQALQGQAKLPAFKKKVDTLMFVEPRYIPLMRDGAAMRDEDEVLERALRAETPKGPRNALQASEMVNDPWYIDLEMTLLPNPEGKSGGSLTWKNIELALDYGALHGIGQWRNASYGRFRWEQLED